MADDKLRFSSSPGSVGQEDDVEVEQDNVPSLQVFELGQGNEPDDNLKPPENEGEDGFTIKEPVFESDSESSGEEEDNEPVDIVNSPIRTPDDSREQISEKEDDQNSTVSKSSNPVEGGDKEEEMKEDNQIDQPAVEPTADSITSSNSPQEGVFEPEDSSAATAGPSKGIDRKRLLSESDEEREDSPGPSKRVRIDADSSDSDGEGDGREEELQAELAGLGGEEYAPAGEEENVGGAVGGGEDEEDSDKSDVESSGRRDTGESDFDIMMHRRKEAMARARRRRKKDGDSGASIDLIVEMIHRMKQAAEDDRRLNLQGKSATKKLVMLPTVLSHLKKSDLFTSFIKCGICSALADWLQPLPDHSLPHMKIREGILDALGTFPYLDSSILKSSKLGKAVMLSYRHPKESKKNKEKAGKLINTWARPIFGLTANLKRMTRDEREERDYSNLTALARRRLSSGEDSQQRLHDDEFEAQKPGDKGWINRARVPMPSNRDYVVRPKWNVNQDMKKGSSKKELSRYEKHLQKSKDSKSRKHHTHAIPVSIEGRKMAL